MTPRMREAYALREQGWKNKEIAEHFGVREKMVSVWYCWVRDALRDEKNVGAL